MPSIGTNPAANRKNLDTECLRCGAFNIPENHICGRCGASLPLVYDEEGKVFSWRGHPRWDETYSKGAKRQPLSTNALFKGVLRVGIFLAIVLFIGMFWSGNLGPLFLGGLVLLLASAALWSARHR